MKKILAIAALSMLAAASTMAQGTLVFANFGGGNTFPIKTPGGVAGAPADNIFVDLYYGSTAGAVTTARGLKVSLVGSGYFTSSSPGNISTGVDIPGIAAGGNAFVKIVAWQGGNTYETATTSKIESAVFQVNSLGGGVITPPNIPLGNGSLQLVPLVAVPEPATYALVALSLGALVLIRRRK